MDILSKIISWSNDNSGFASVLIFLITVAFGFASGIFNALRRKPTFRIKVIDGPTFCCTFPTGREFNGNEAHRTGISLYLDITNTGSSASSIGEIHVAYHNYKLRYSFFWFWLTKEIVALSEFQVAIGAKTKVFPFLKQGNPSFFVNTDHFLEVGRNVNGVVYFEQPEAWGGFRPRVKNNRVRVKVKVFDCFGRSHTSVFSIRNVALIEAKKYNPSFGDTWETLEVNDHEGTGRAGV